MGNGLVGAGLVFVWGMARQTSQVRFNPPGWSGYLCKIPPRWCGVAVAKTPPCARESRPAAASSPEMDKWRITDRC